MPDAKVSEPPARPAGPAPVEREPERIGEGGLRAALARAAASQSGLNAKLPWLVFAGTAVVLALVYGVHGIAQTTLNGLSAGAVIAIGAVGLTLVYSILKLVNFAHGDFLTLGAYMTLLAGTAFGLPVVVGAIFGMAVTAALAMSLELVLWRPMRRRGAGLLQLMLISLGIALILRATIQFAFGPEIRALAVDTTSTVGFLGLSLGRTEAIVVGVGVITLGTVAVVLRHSLLGWRMRALSDNLDLAETSGIDSSRVILWTWLFAGSLAGLAGVLAGARSSLSPEFGFELMLPMFAAVVMGGIGNVFGALVAGVMLAVGMEWSTLALSPVWKVPVGFGILLLTLAVRPEGIFGKGRTI